LVKKEEQQSTQVEKTTSPVKPKIQDTIGEGEVCQKICKGGAKKEGERREESFVHSRKIKQDEMCGHLGSSNRPRERGAGPTEKKRTPKEGGTIWRGRRNADCQKGGRQRKKN